MSQVELLFVELSFEFLFFGNFLMIFKSESFHMQRCCGKSSELAKKWRKVVHVTSYVIKGASFISSVIQNFLGVQLHSSHSWSYWVLKFKTKSSWEYSSCFKFRVFSSLGYVIIPVVSFWVELFHHKIKPNDKDNADCLLWQDMKSCPV